MNQNIAFITKNKNEIGAGFFCKETYKEKFWCKERILSPLNTQLVIN